MLSRVVKWSKKAGFSPGSLIHIGNSYVGKSEISLIRYDETFYREKHLDMLADTSNINLFQKKEMAVVEAKLLH